MPASDNLAGLEAEITRLLSSVNALAGYPLSLVCTEQGLLIASAGEDVTSEVVGGLTSLFDEIVVRAIRDLGFSRVDEITLKDERSYRYVLRPLPIDSRPRLFLVVQAPANAAWRQHTNLLSKRLVTLLEPLLAGADPDNL